MRILILLCLLSPLLLGAMTQDDPPIMVPVPTQPAPAPTGPVGPNWDQLYYQLGAALVLLLGLVAQFIKQIIDARAAAERDRIAQLKADENKKEIAKAQELSLQNQQLLHEAKQDAVNAKEAATNASVKAEETKQIVAGIAAKTNVP